MMLKVIYRKNLKMSPGKLAAQCGHSLLGLSNKVGMKNVDPNAAIRVLEASDKKFHEWIHYLEKNKIPYHIVKDAGKTEVEPGTNTCLAFIEAY